MYDAMIREIVIPLIHEKWTNGTVSRFQMPVDRLPNIVDALDAKDPHWPVWSSSHLKNQPREQQAIHMMAYERYVPTIVEGIIHFEQREPVLQMGYRYVYVHRVTGENKGNDDTFTFVTTKPKEEQATEAIRAAMEAANLPLPSSISLAREQILVLPGLDTSYASVFTLGPNEMSYGISIAVDMVFPAHGIMMRYLTKKGVEVSMDAPWRGYLNVSESRLSSRYATFIPA